MNNSQMNAPSGAAASQKQQSAQPQERRAEINLRDRYGSIGIEAVAAAVRYAGTGKNPVGAPVVSDLATRLHETAV
jgi:hypothetical protein